MGSDKKEMRTIRGGGERVEKNLQHGFTFCRLFSVPISTKQDVDHISAVRNERVHGCIDRLSINVNRM
jgi:hypothetical protein